MPQLQGGDPCGSRPEIRGDVVWFSDTYNDRIVRYRMLDGG